MMQNSNENSQSQSRVTKVVLVVTLLAVVGVVAVAQSSWTPAAGHVSTKLRPGKQTDVAGDKLCPCPYIYAPVCGADGLTYPNSCVAKCQSAPVVCNKPCPCTKEVVNDDDDSDKQAAALKEKRTTEGKIDVKKDYTCPPNTIFSQCGAYPTCQRTCKNKTPRPCPLVCFPGCVCKPGFIRISDKTLICVPSTAC